MEVQNPTALWLLLLIVYVLPAMIALLRRHPSAAPIIALDLLAGWTVVGWIAAAVWALWPVTMTRRVEQGAAGAATAPRDEAGRGPWRGRLHRRRHGRRGDA